MVTNPENGLKKTFGERLVKHLDSNFFKHPVYPYELKEDLIVRLKLNSFEKVVLCSGDTAAIYKLSDISLEHDAIFDKRYGTTIYKLYAGSKAIPYTKEKSVHSRRFLKEMLIKRLALITYPFVHYKACCYYFFDLISVITLLTKMKSLTTLPSRKF